MQKFSKRQIEFYLLLGLCLVLPIFEASKNLLWLAFIGLWIYNRSKDRNWGGRWNKWDTLIWIWISSGYLVAYFAAFHKSEWGGVNDLLRYGLLLWTVKRSGYDRGQLLLILITLVTSCVAALLIALWQIYIEHSRTVIELNSVGHLNHSAIYMLISYTCALALLMSYWKESKRVWHVAGIGALALLALGILLTSSRAAAGVMFLVTLCLGLVWLRRSRLPLVALTLCMLGGATLAFTLDMQIVIEQQTVSQKQDMLTGREPIWNSAILAWQKFPLFGVGMSNYGGINSKNIQQWLSERGEQFHAARYAGSSHAHSLYFTTLAERGLVGFIPLIAILCCWLYYLIAYIPKASASNFEFAAWGASFGALFVTVGVGLFNTTLHHEHAMLSVLLLAVWLSSLTKTGTDARPD